MAQPDPDYLAETLREHMFGLDRVREGANDQDRTREEGPER